MGFKFRTKKKKHNFMETYGGRVRYRSTILLLLTTRCMWAVSFKPRPLTRLSLEAVWTPETLYWLWRRDLIFLLPRIEFRSSGLESTHCNKVIPTAGRAEGNCEKNQFTLRSILAEFITRVLSSPNPALCVSMCIKTSPNRTFFLAIVMHLHQLNINVSF